LLCRDGILVERRRGSFWGMWVRDGGFAVVRCGGRDGVVEIRDARCEDPCSPRQASGRYLRLEDSDQHHGSFISSRQLSIMPFSFDFLALALCTNVFEV
jgi:hypothetical protein